MTKLAIAALAGLAAVASADVLSTGPGGGSAERAIINVADYANVSFNRDLGHTIVTIEFVSDIPSFDLVGDSSNFVAVLNMGGPATMHGIGWDVSIATVGGSWLSEARLYFDDNIAPDLSGLFLTPGFASSFPGTGSFSSGGILDLFVNGIPDIVLPNGELRLEFHETFDDVANVEDGWWLAGSILTLDMAIVPAPGALALLGLGGLAIRRRR